MRTLILIVARFSEIILCGDGSSFTTWDRLKYGVLDDCFEKRNVDWQARLYSMENRSVVLMSCVWSGRFDDPDETLATKAPTKVGHVFNVPDSKQDEHVGKRAPRHLSLTS